MGYVRTAFRIVTFLLLFAFLHYLLPQHDVVRVVSTKEFRVDFSVYNRIFFAQPDSGNEELPNRHVRFIDAVKKKTFLFGFIPRDAEKVMVYRNEDTGWIWPPYFKFDSSNLQAEAADLVSNKAEPQWVVLTHYGWRNIWFTIYPNATAIRPVDGPNPTVIPWFNIFFFIFLIVAYVMVRVMWRQFRERKIDPMLEDASDIYARVEGGVADRRGRMQRWLDTWRSKPKR